MASKCQQEQAEQEQEQEFSARLALVIANRECYRAGIVSMSGKPYRHLSAVCKVGPTTLADDQAAAAFALHDGATLLVPPFGVPLTALPMREGVQLERGGPAQQGTLVSVRVDK